MLVATNTIDSSRGSEPKPCVPGTSVTAMGFGKADPIASNGTPAGRQQNRRVEIVVSGEPIGVGATNVP